MRVEELAAIMLSDIFVVKLIYIVNTTATSLTSAFLCSC
jgi:hypothetical protein